ncbi:MAG: glycoside hydrolase family 88 protein, partial [Oxalobacteraceae bacterium]
MKYTLVLAALLTGLTTLAQPLPRPDDVIGIVRRVNDHWQQTHPEHGRAFWDNAAYHTGNMEAYFLTRNDAYRKYSEAWAEHNEW